jgi:hypothetical protein
MAAMRTVSASSMARKPVALLAYDATPARIVLRMIESTTSHTKRLFHPASCSRTASSDTGASSPRACARSMLWSTRTRSEGPRRAAPQAVTGKRSVRSCDQEAPGLLSHEHHHKDREHRQYGADRGGERETLAGGHHVAIVNEPRTPPRRALRTAWTPPPSRDPPAIRGTIGPKSCTI